MQLTNARVWINLSEALLIDQTEKRAIIIFRNRPEPVEVQTPDLLKTVRAEIARRDQQRAAQAASDVESLTSDSAATTQSTSDLSK